ncbi:hypothetical protein HAX54_009292 [Datura stramonium]|uniref:Uncharacterized protein n=1 Tax=Datura stramonium TaxID=4076 RepID=A0ABS8TFY1_DATST|nr:hypothetical protein [Datura stramonium]
MGRNIPLGEVNPTNHPLIYILFLTASIAAIVGIVSSLCGLLDRIKGSPDSSTEAVKENADVVTSTSPDEEQPENATLSSDAKNDEPSDETTDANILQQPLPPPPAMMAAASNNLRTTSMAPTRVSRSNSTIKTIQSKLNTSMSMKAFSGAITQRHEKITSKLKHEDQSIWKKQIILGEKCKVPNQDEEDTVLYDESGNKITTYHPKQLSAMSMSRQSSDIDANAIPK